MLAEQEDAAPGVTAPRQHITCDLEQQTRRASGPPQQNGPGCCGLIFSITYILVAVLKGNENNFCDGYWKTDVNAQLFGQVLMKDFPYLSLFTSDTKLSSV